jgi:hypothetical protein
LLFVPLFAWLIVVAKARTASRLAGSSRSSGGATRERRPGRTLPPVYVRIWADPVFRALSPTEQRLTLCELAVIGAARLV